MHGQRRCFVLSLTVFGLLMPVLSFADEPAEPAKETTEYDFQSAEDRFREMVISKAAGPESLVQRKAISIALKRDYVDERFNQFADALATELKSREPNPDRASRLVGYLPITTVDSSTKIDLLLASYSLVKSGDARIRRVISIQVNDQLAQLKDQLSKLLLDRLENREKLAVSIPALRRLDGDGSQFMSVLMEIASEDDEDASILALEQIDRYLVEFERWKQATLVTQANRRQLVTEPSEKYLSYARRIIARADKNNDGVLTSSEWKSMLIDPRESDANKDGRIALKEYAVWIENRSRN